MNCITVETERYALGNGDLFVKLSLPKLRAEGGAMDKNFAAYYGRLRKSFEDYTRKKMEPNAAARRGAPHGAALNTVVCHETETVLSLYADITVSDGNGSRQSRTAVLWHKPTGNILMPGRLFVKGAKKRLRPLLLQAAEEKSTALAEPLFSDAAARLKRGFRWENFYLSPSGAVFFLGGGVLNQRQTPFALPLSASALEELLTREASAMLWER